MNTKKITALTLNFRPILPALPAQAQNGRQIRIQPNRRGQMMGNGRSKGLFFYNQTNRSGAIGHFASDGSFVQTQSFGASEFGFWTQIVTTEK